LIRPLGVSILTLGLAVAHVDAAGGERRITKASNVRLRNAAATSASVTAELPLGTELAVLEQTAAVEPWYHVTTDDGRDGWVLGNLTALLDLERRDRTIESIVVDRLRASRNVSAGLPIFDHNFHAGLQLFNLVERTAARLNDREAQARFALYRLRSMRILLSGVPFRRGDSDPYRSWIRAHQDAARYDEPGGTWIVDPSYVIAVHDAHRGTAAADDIAWFLVENGLFGECEGDVPCYVAAANRLDGWYLQSHPQGRHTDEANVDIAARLNDAWDNLQNSPAVLMEFDPKTRCNELRTSLDPLVVAVTASNSTRKAGALAAIDRYAQLCR
jgi:hypothetical protein